MLLRFSLEMIKKFYGIYILNVRDNIESETKNVKLGMLVIFK